MEIKKIIDYIFRAVALGVSIAALVLLVLRQGVAKDIITLIAIGMVCISIVLMRDKK